MRLHFVHLQTEGTVESSLAYRTREHPFHARNRIRCGRCIRLLASNFLRWYDDNWFGRLDLWRVHLWPNECGDRLDSVHIHRMLHQIINILVERLAANDAVVHALPVVPMIDQICVAYVQFPAIEASNIFAIGHRNHATLNGGEKRQFKIHLGRTADKDQTLTRR